MVQAGFFLGHRFAAVSIAHRCRHAGHRGGTREHFLARIKRRVSLVPERRANIIQPKRLYGPSLRHWRRRDYNTALTVARALRWKLSPETYFAGTLGIGMVDRTTDHLGTQGQFVARLAFGRKFGKYDLSIGETHYSNGKTALRLNWQGPNTGEDFLTVMLAREF